MNNRKAMARTNWGMARSGCMGLTACAISGNPPNGGVPPFVEDDWIDSGWMLLPEADREVAAVLGDKIVLCVRRVFLRFQRSGACLRFEIADVTAVAVVDAFSYCIWCPICIVADVFVADWGCCHE